MFKTYSEMMKFDSFKERFLYLKLDGFIGEDTFGNARFINQKFYRSNLWRRTRSHIIVRDNNNDLAVDGYPIIGMTLVHHINPITYEDIVNNTAKLTDPENLISVCHDTHNAIHFGNATYGDPQEDYVERSVGDTTLW